MRFVQPVGILVLIVTVLPAATWGGPPRRPADAIFVDPPPAGMFPVSLLQPESDDWIEAPLTDLSMRDLSMHDLSIHEDMRETPPPVDRSEEHTSELQSH